MKMRQIIPSGTQHINDISPEMRAILSNTKLSTEEVLIKKLANGTLGETIDRVTAVMFSENASFLSDIDARFSNLLSLIRNNINRLPQIGIEELEKCEQAIKSATLILGQRQLEAAKGMAGVDSIKNRTRGSIRIILSANNENEAVRYLAAGK